MKSWILLNRKSTTDIFEEFKYLTIIKTVPTILELITNEVLLTTNQQVNLNDYGNVLYHPKYINNILSLRNVKKKNRIIYDSNNGERFIVINTILGEHDIIFSKQRWTLLQKYEQHQRIIYVKYRGVTLKSLYPTII